MINRLQFWLLTTLAAAALVLAIFNAVYFSGNRVLQSELSARTQFVQQSLQLEPLHQTIIRNLVELSAKNNDMQIRDLLVAHGISFQVNAPEAKTEQAAKNAERPTKR